MLRVGSVGVETGIGDWLSEFEGVGWCCGSEPPMEALADMVSGLPV